MSQPPAPYRPQGSYPPPQYGGPPPQGPYQGSFQGSFQGPPPGQPYAPPPGPPPGYPAPYGPPPVPPKKKGSAGKVIAIVLVVLLVLIGVGGYFVYRAVRGVTDRVSGLTDGASTTCSAVSTEDVNAVLGGQWTVVQLGGALGGITAPVLDTRVLPDAATTCWATQEQDGKLARVARYQGADAAARFAAEKQKAKGSSTDQGGGVSVTTDGYLGKDVQAGDEAFCTTGDPLSSAGALERRGDTLFYVSTTAAGDGAAAVPDISAGAGGQVSFGTDAANCALAVKLIEKAH